MAHELIPRKGSLSVAEIARLLGTAFPYVEVDPDDALKRVYEMAARLERVDFGRLFPGSEQRVRDRVARLRALVRGEALTIEFGDLPPAGRRTSILVVPGDPIQFGYRSAEDETELSGLVTRCADVLDCDVVVI